MNLLHPFQFNDDNILSRRSNNNIYICNWARGRAVKIL